MRWSRAEVLLHPRIQDGAGESGLLHSHSGASQAREEALKRAAAAERQQRRAFLPTVEPIATSLDETDLHTREKIHNPVTLLGVEETRALLQEVLAIEAAGEMFTADGSRRRTPGGVYHYLLKQRLIQAGRKADVKKV
ncbi:MAG: phosphorylated adapter RNA export RNA-binding domain-containing protein [Chloroflexaceae bacterium]